MMKFPIIMSNGTKVYSLDELKKYFDLESVLGHYKSGKLLTWLRNNHRKTEADAVEALDENASDFQQKLCAIFGAEFSGSGVDMEEIVRRQERLTKLRQFTDEDEFIWNIDAVAFDQEELIDLLDEGCEKIYLCGEKFTVPASQKGRAYIGVNSPKVSISGTVGDDWAERNITFTGCDVQGLRQAEAQADTAQIESPADSGSSGMFEAVPVEVADDIYRQLRFPWGSKYIETQDYILFMQDNIDAINKHTGERFTVVEKSKIPSGSGSYFSDKWVFHQNTVFASWGENTGNNHIMYQIDIEGKTITSLDFRVDVCQWATNGRYFAWNRYGKVTCIDLEQRKKYSLQHEATGGGSGAIVCADTALYFVTGKLDSKSDMVYELIEYSFLNKVERVITTLPKTDAAEALALYNDKLFILLETEIEEDYYGYHVCYVDLVSDSPKYHSPCQRAVRVWRSSTIKEYIGGWFFVSNKTNYPIERFDFETMEFVTVAEGCGYSEHNSSGLFGCGRGYWFYHANKIDKIGQWLYFKQGRDEGCIGETDTIRVSLYQPMQTEVLQKVKQNEILDEPDEDECR